MLERDRRSAILAWICNPGRKKEGAGLLKRIHIENCWQNGEQIGKRDHIR